MPNKITFPKFAIEVCEIISLVFPKTYFVGGAVRNVILNKKITDIDIATSALPEEVTALLKLANIQYSDAHRSMGVIIAKKGKQLIEIATFRKESYSKSRFPKVTFTKSIRVDSTRRDFTVNAIYYSPITKELLDFSNGIDDLYARHLKFIGDPKEKIFEDPIRILRAYKFNLKYNLKIDQSTENILKKNLHLLKKVSKQRLRKEISNIDDVKIKKYFEKVIHSIS